MTIALSKVYSVTIYHQGRLGGIADWTLDIAAPSPEEARRLALARAPKWIRQSRLWLEVDGHRIVPTMEGLCTF